MQRSKDLIAMQMASKNRATVPWLSANHHLITLDRVTALIALIAVGYFTLNSFGALH